MSTFQYDLVQPPTTEQRRDLWLQHAAGFVLFQDVREYAIDKIDPSLSPDARTAALKGIDDAVYGLMMVLDGISRTLSNSTFAVRLKVAAQLLQRAPSGDGNLIAEVDLAEGDGMCVGYHGWLKGEFGEDQITLDAWQTDTDQ
jgi:hypothetical protein